MRTHWLGVVAAALAIVVAASGCSGGGGGAAGTSNGRADSKGPGHRGSLKTSSVPPTMLSIAEKGGGVALRSGESTVAVYVPAGSAKAGATWVISPLAEAPNGVSKPLGPGVYVDTNGSDPTGPCLIAFTLPPDAPKNATIVRCAEDGSPATIIPTSRVQLKYSTVLQAAVDGFSAYTTSEEDAAARDKAFVDNANKRGKQVDWTIKVIGKETQKVEGWTFNYELDLFASGGGVGQGGTYKGHSSLSLKGKYKGPASIVKAFGTVSGIGRDQSLTFEILDPSLGYLTGGDDPYAPPVDGKGTMKLTGMGSIDLTAIAPNVKGHVDRKNDKVTGGVPFTITIKGEDVQVEIDKVGIFPGKILRTSK